MPTITFSYTDFLQLLGKKLPLEEFGRLLLLFAKAEAGKFEKETGEITIELDDTNLPYLWCPEGLARFLKRILGKEKGIAKLNLMHSSYKIVVDSSVKKVRPYIAAFIAKGKKLDDYLLKQLVQMQEKLCENYGRKRQKVSIGLYSYKRIAFPVHYKAVPPDSVKFVPLEFDRPLSLKEILRQHPKGQQYGWILQDAEKYPLLADDKGEVLSFPPIINSNFTGRLEIGDSEILFEATGTDEESINLAANIFAQNMAERGFEIHSVIVSCEGRTIVSPAAKKEKMKITAEAVKELIGLKLKEPELRQLLLKAGYDAEGSYAVVPPYRADIIHPVDIIEDVAIAYGFDKIKDEPLASYTAGEKDKAAEIINPLRKIAVGMGFQEIFSHILADRNSMLSGSGIPSAAAAENEKNIVQLENFMSETYSAVRNSLLPGLLDVLARNKHEDYPQRIFEEGIVASRAGKSIFECRSIALVSAHPKADFTEQKQHLTAFMRTLGIEFTIQKAAHPTFTKGRVGSIIAIGKPVGVIGEISPAVLSWWGIEMPAAALEIDLSALLNRVSGQ
ncbi:phenylalanine--tRNA ligase subunit beta [Candidatus Woesearchaeota archaeon]|nr:phenylalanine--tRNA ligase subunit beta [Candidatus Woesearchaeota archaeon]